MALASFANEADLFGYTYDATYSAASNTGTNQNFGQSVSISDDGLSLVVGSPGYGINLETQQSYSAGAFSVFTRTATNAAWTVVSGNQNVVYGGVTSSGSTPSTSYGAFLKDTNGSYYNNAQVGTCVRISGNGLVLAVCAPGLVQAGQTIPSASNSPRVYGGIIIYTRTSSTAAFAYSALIQLVISSGLYPTYGASFGSWCAITPAGEAVVIGAPQWTNGNTYYGSSYAYTGAVFVYVKKTSGGAYTQLYNYTTYGPICSSSADDYMGSCCDVSQIYPTYSSSAMTIVAGAPLSALSTYDLGAAYLFYIPVSDYTTAIAGTAPTAKPPLNANPINPSTTGAKSQIVAAYTAATAAYNAQYGVTLAINYAFPNSYAGICQFGASVAISRDGTTVAVGTGNAEPSQANTLWGFVCIYQPQGANGLTAPAGGQTNILSNGVLCQPNYNTQTGNGGRPPINGFGSRIAISHDGSTIAVSGVDPGTTGPSGTTPPAIQKCCLFYVYTLLNVNGAGSISTQTPTYTLMPGVFYLQTSRIAPTVKYAHQGTGDPNWVLTWNTTSNTTTQNEAYVDIAMTASGNIVAIGDSNMLAGAYKAGNGSSFGATTTGFREGIAFTHQVREAFPVTYIVEDDMGALCDNDYNDLLMRVADNSTYGLQAGTSNNTNVTPINIQLTIDFLRFAAFYSCSVYLLFADGFFPSGTSAATAFANANVTYYPQSGAGTPTTSYSLTSVTLTTAQISACQLSTSTYTGAFALQLFADTSISGTPNCIPTALTSNPSAYFAAWQTSPFTTPYVYTLVVNIPAILTNGSPQTSNTLQHPYTFVFAPNRYGTVGYFSTLPVPDASNPIAVANGGTTMCKVIQETTSYGTAANGIFQPTFEGDGILTVYTASGNASALINGTTFAFTPDAGGSGSQYGTPSASVPWANATTYYTWKN